MPRVRGGEAVQGPVEYLKKRMRCVFLDADPGVNGRGRACITDSWVDADICGGTLRIGASAVGVGNVY